MTDNMFGSRDRRRAGGIDARSVAPRPIDIRALRGATWTGWSQEYFFDVLAAVSGGTVAGRSEHRAVAHTGSFIR
jgi:hypothetical protein